MRTIDAIETALKTNGWETKRWQLTFAPMLKATKGDLVLYVCFSNGAVTRQTSLQKGKSRRPRYLSVASGKAEHLIKFIHGQVTEEEF